MTDYTHILPILQTMAAVICLGGASLLFLRGQNNRSRRMLAMIMSAWGLVYAVRVVGMLLGNRNLNFTSIGVMETFVLVVGNLYLIFLLLYPLEIVRPRWLNMKHAVVLLLPYLSISLFYYLVLFLFDQEPMKLQDMSQFIEHIGTFNVGYRLFMAFSVIAYLVYLFRLTWHYKRFYLQWCHDNYSNDEKMDISWLRQYGIGVLLIGVAYFGLLLGGDACCLVTHNLIVQCFFCYTLYKGLFQDNPYTENFLSYTVEKAGACLRTGEEAERPVAESDCSLKNENAFLKKLPVYCDEVSAWMIQEKPYLNPNFKLMDVSDILPLNRSYISRVFNEGFGNSFSDVVRKYRIREAECMLANRKDIPVGQIGELCGFSSPSVFHRAFVRSHDGLTPNRYRKQAEEKDPSGKNPEA